jgi:hypothetical protein
MLWYSGPNIFFYWNAYRVYCSYSAYKGSLVIQELTTQRPQDIICVPTDALNGTEDSFELLDKVNKKGTPEQRNNVIDALINSEEAKALRR